MTITTTAIGFSFSSLGFAFCGIRFFNAFQKVGGSRAGRKIGILLSAFFLSNALQHGLLAIGSLFFAKNSEALYRVVVIDHLLLTIATLIGVYLVFYTIFPSISPWPAVIATSILGITVIGLTGITHPRPFVDLNGGVDWNMSPWLEFFLSYLLFSNIGALLAVFIHSFLQAKSREVKTISLIIVVLALMGLINVFRRFLLSGTMPNFLKTPIHDLTLAVIGLLFIGVFIAPPIVIKLISRIQDH